MTGRGPSLALVAVTLLSVAASGFVAAANFLRLAFVRRQAAQLHVAESWMPVLGAAHVAAALGLLLGLRGVPVVGTAAAAGLVLYFVGALATHWRARDRAVGPALGFLVLSAAALAAWVAA